MRIDILTLFPGMFEGVLGASILKRAAESIDDPGRGIERPAVVSYHLTDIRDYTENKHQKVDAPPYGGGPGMVMQCQPIRDAVQAVESAEPERPPTRLLTSPQGETFNQPMAENLAGRDRLLIVAGHYEGVDERVLAQLAPIREVSVGDYVLSGGELAAMTIIDAVVRLLPGVLGDDQSAAHDSFSQAKEASGGQIRGRGLDYPHYTRPKQWQGLDVPEVLLSGDHARIDQWRREQARRRTAERRPDLVHEADVDRSDAESSDGDSPDAAPPDSDSSGV